MSNKSNSYILKLNELSQEDINIVGAKAANLGELLRVGLPIPDGFALTTAAFNQFLSSDSLNSDSSSEEVEAAPLPPHITEALLMASAELGDIPLAVRSSGIEEDLSGAPMPGSMKRYWMSEVLTL